MARDTVVDDAIGAAMDKLEARNSEAEKETIEGVDAETVEAAAPDPEPETKVEEAAAEGEGDEQVSDSEAKPENSEQIATPPVVDAVEAPGILSAETKALWSKVPADVAKAIAQDALRTQQHMSRLANESQRSRAWEERVNSEFSTKEDLDAHRDRMRAAGVKDEVEELQRARAWNRVFLNDRIGGIQALMAQEGITPQDLIEGAFSEGPEQQATDPRYDELSKKFEQLESEKKAEAERREHEAFAAKISAWTSGKDRYGKTRSEFSRLYGPQIDQEWQTVLAENSQLGHQISLEDSLTEAFNRVQSKVYQAHGINPAKPAAPTVEERTAQAAKVAAARTVSSGAPRSEQITKKPKRDYKNDKERVEAAIERAEAKIGGARR